MPTGRSQGRLRPPADDLDYVRRGLVEYTNEQLEAIFGTFTPKAGFDRASFSGRLNRIAWNTVQLQSWEPRRPRSEAALRWRRLANQTETVVNRLKGLTTDDWAELERAAAELAKEGTPPPGVKPERLPWGRPRRRNARSGRDHTGLWPYDLAFANARRIVPWLHGCILRAADNAEAEKRETGGGTPNVAEHELFCGLVELFHDSSAEPARADSPRAGGKPRPDDDSVGDGDDDDDDVAAYDEDVDRGEAGGNLIDFLDACLQPLLLHPEEPNLRPKELERARRRRRNKIYYTLERLGLLPPGKRRKGTGGPRS